MCACRPLQRLPAGRFLLPGTLSLLPRTTRPLRQGSNGSDTDPWQRRLRRAQAVPPADAGVDVAAFVESSKLLGELCDQMPVTPGQPTWLPVLPAGPYTARRMEAGLYRLALAAKMCPTTPVQARHFMGHLGAYGVSDFGWVEPVGMLLSKVAAGGSRRASRGASRSGGRGGKSGNTIAASSGGAAASNRSSSSGRGSSSSGRE